jgi:hypothetical protein
MLDSNNMVPPVSTHGVPVTHAAISMPHIATGTPLCGGTLALLSVSTRHTRQMRASRDSPSP